MDMERLKIVKKIIKYLAFPMVVLPLAGLYLNSMVMFFIGLVICAVWLFVYIVFLRCPFCRKHLGRQINEYCPHCKKRIE